MNESDERYSTVEEAIFDAFFLILKDKDLDKVTVSDVIKKAGIVRSTFYNHYENIPALLNAAEDKTIHDIFQMMEDFHPKNDHDMCHSYFVAICEYTRKNPFVANLLQSPRGDEFFEKALTMFHTYVTNITSNSLSGQKARTEFSYYIASTIGSTIGVLHKWTADDFSTPAEDVADILSNIFLSGVLPYLSK